MLLLLRTPGEIQLEGSAAATSSVVAAVSVTHTLEGASDGVSTVSGSAISWNPIAGSSAGVSTVSAAISVNHRLAGLSAGISAASSSLLRCKLIASTTGGNSSVIGTIDVKHALVGSSAGVSTVAGNTIVQHALGGQSDGVATVTGSLDRVKYVAGTSGGSSTVAGAVDTVTPLSGTVTCTSTVTGGISYIFQYLEGASAGSSSISGTLRHMGSQLVDLYLEITGTPSYNNNVVDNYKGSWTLPCTVRVGNYAGYVIETGMAVVGWGHHNQGGESDPYTGGIILSSDASTAPYIDVFTVASGDSPYPWETATAMVPRVRVGNLNGVAGVATDQWGIAFGTNLSSSDSTARHVIASDQQFTMKNIDIAMYKSTKQTVSIEADGDVKLGTDISSPSTTSFTFDAATGTVSLTGYMATGADLPWADITGLPSTLDAVNGAGLYLTSSYLGYWDGDSWNAYIKSDGTFKFSKDGDNYLEFAGSAFTAKFGGGNVRLDSSGIAIIGNTETSGRIGWYTAGFAEESSTIGVHVGSETDADQLEIKASGVARPTLLMQGTSSASGSSVASYLKVDCEFTGTKGSGTPAHKIYANIEGTSISTTDKNGVAVTGRVTASKSVASGTSKRDHEGNIEAHGNSDAFGLFRSQERAYVGANIYRDGSSWKIDNGSSVYAYLSEVNEPGDIWQWLRSASGNADSTISTFTYPMKLTGAGELTVLSKFGCNSKSAQAAYALDSAISGTIDDTYGSNEHAVMDSLVSQVNKIRAALVANGICS